MFLVLKISNFNIFCFFFQKNEYCFGTNPKFNIWSVVWGGSTKIFKIYIYIYIYFFFWGGGGGSHY